MKLSCISTIVIGCRRLLVASVRHQLMSLVLNYMSVQVTGGLKNGGNSPHMYIVDRTCLEKKPRVWKSKAHCLLDAGTRCLIRRLQLGHNIEV